jgi:tetratricopeptide (TPR) repeat protein
VAEQGPREDYPRADVRRRFKISERELRSWERQRLILPARTYSFSDLIAIKAIAKLRENHIPAPRIGRAVESLRRKLDWIKQPLAELGFVSDGKKIAVRVAGQTMEALTGQILFDFAAAELGSLREFPDRKITRNRLRESEAWFQKGLDAEETGAPAELAIEAYRKALEMNPAAAGALVNLGTIFYRQKNFVEAEKHYVQAVVADPSYPLAEFNLGNLYDEQGRGKDAADHYHRALELNPAYADAHFNLALLAERSGEALKAVSHWKTYLKLDPSGQWAEIARRQLDRLREATVIQSR